MLGLSFSRAATVDAVRSSHAGCLNFLRKMPNQPVGARKAPRLEWNDPGEAVLVGDSSWGWRHPGDGGLGQPKFSVLEL